MIDFLFFSFLIEHVNPKSFQGISHEDKSLLIFLSFCSAMHCTVNHQRALHLPRKPNWPSYVTAGFDFFQSMMETISKALNLWALPWLHPATNTTCSFLTFPILWMINQVPLHGLKIFRWNVHKVHYTLQ